MPRILSSILFLPLLIFLFTHEACASTHTQQATQSINMATMASLSPLLTLSAMGVKTRLTAQEGAVLPFHARTEFLALALSLLVLLFCKDTIGELFPLAKKPLDALDVVQNKAMGVACAAVVLPKVAAAAKGAVAIGMSSAWNMFGPDVAFAATGAAQVTPGWIDTASWWISYTLGAAAFYAIWCASHMVNVLGMLAPVPLVGPVLKAIRLALLGALASADAIHPLLGLAMSALILFTAAKAAGWSTRLMVFGAVSGFDILSLRWKSPMPGEAILAFSSSSGSFNLPRRVLGKLTATEGVLSFAYKPFFLAPRLTKNVDTPEGLAVARAVAFPLVIARNRKSYSTLFTLPPRYRGHEQEIAERLGCGAVPSALGRGIRSAWAWIKGFRRQETAPSTQE